MAKDSRVVLVSIDLGYGMWDKIRSKYNGTQFYAMPASEFSSIGFACGLWMSGKIPIVYSITPFLLWRGAEMIRLYLNHDLNGVKILGGGRDKDYATQGFTHDASDDAELLSIFPNVRKYWPSTIEEMKRDTENWLYNGQPSYLNLRR